MFLDLKTKKYIVRFFKHMYKYELYLKRKMSLGLVIFELTDISYNKEFLGLLKPSFKMTFANQPSAQAWEYFFKNQLKNYEITFDTKTVLLILCFIFLGLVFFKRWLLKFLRSCFADFILLDDASRIDELNLLLSLFTTTDAYSIENYIYSSDTFFKFFINLIFF